MLDGVAVLARCLSFIASFEATGGAFFIAVFGGALPLSSQASGRRIRVAMVAALVLVLLQFAVDAARLAGDFTGLWDPQIQRLAWSTASGSVLRLHLLALVLAAASLRTRRPTARLLSAAGCLLLAVTFVMVGHSVDHSHRTVLAALLLAHLLSVTFWFGALWPLRTAVTLEQPADAAGVLVRFSRCAVWLVPALLVAGITLVLMLVPNFATFGQPYGQLLLAKMLGFTLLIGLAAWNKLRLTRALSQHAIGAVSSLRLSLTLEYLLIAAVLCVTATMTTLYSPD